MGSVLAVTHPGQYKAGLDMLKTLKNSPSLLREPAELTKVLDGWCTPFSGVSVICNWQMQCHKIVHARHEWYDVLATMGTHPTINFDLPGLQTTLAYSPCTIVVLCSWILSHSVESSERRD